MSFLLYCSIYVVVQKLRLSQMAPLAIHTHNYSPLAIHIKISDMNTQRSRLCAFCKSGEVGYICRLFWPYANQSPFALFARVAESGIHVAYFVRIYKFIY